MRALHKGTVAIVTIARGTHAIELQINHRM